MNKLKPFNLEDAMHGEPVIMRSGESYTFGAYNPLSPNGYQIIGWDAQGMPMHHRADGAYLTDRESGNDLFMKPIKKELWLGVNINPDRDGVHTVCNARPSEEELIQYLKKYGLRLDIYQPVKITIEV